MHAVMSLPVEFLPLEYFNMWRENCIVSKLVIMYMTNLPGFCYKLHCNCDNPNTLQCLSRIVVMKDMINKLHVVRNNWVPWVNCCSLFSYVTLEPGSLRILTFWRFMYSRVYCVLNTHLKDFEIYTWENKVICVFRTEVVVCLQLLAELHGKFNLPEGKGYHLTVVDSVWRSAETATLNSGRTCSLRYFTIRGIQVQERVIKKKLRNRSRAMLQLLHL